MSLKYSVNHVVNKCDVIQAFYISQAEHVILKGSRILGMVKSIDFNLKSPATLSPDKTIGPSFIALKLGIDFSSQAKVPDGISFQYEAVFLQWKSVV